MNRVLHLGLILWLGLLSGCQTAPVHSDNTDSELSRWIDTDISTWLGKTLSQHPRFQDQSFSIVAMNGQHSPERLDGLRQHIQQQLLDHLLTLPGLKPLHRTPELPGQQGRCSLHETADVIIALEIQHHVPHHSLRIRLLDGRSGEWISGFSQVWEGQLSVAERRLWSKKHTQAEHKGRRHQPFERHESDALAQHLATELVCKLKRQGHNRLRMQPLKPDPSSAEFDQNLLQQLHLSLGQHIPQREHADGFRLNIERRPVQGTVYQLWARLQPHANQEAVSTIVTDTYVNLPAPQQRPLITKQDTKRVPSVALEPTQIIKRFTISFERDRRLCQGRRGCRLLNVEMGERADLYILRQDEMGRLQRVLPAQCRPDFIAPRLNAGDRYQFRPYPGGISDGEQYYALAVSNPRLSERLAGHLRKLPGPCAKRIPRIPRQRWLAGLDSFIDASPEHIQWQRLKAY